MVVPASEQLVVEHGEIKGFMEVMIMGYKVKPRRCWPSSYGRDTVRFTIDTQAQAIVKIEPPRK